MAPDDCGNDVGLSEDESLIRENYRLIYEIEQEEYLNGKFLSMINNVKEQLDSIKNYIIEIKLTREQDLENFLYENVYSKSKIVGNSEGVLREKNGVSQEILLNQVVDRFRRLYNEMFVGRTELIRRQESKFRESKSRELEQDIDEFERVYGIDLRSGIKQ